jgi:hypothetical protein
MSKDYLISSQVKESYRSKGEYTSKRKKTGNAIPLLFFVAKTEEKKTSSQ